MVRPAFLALIFETEYHADYSMLCWNKNKPTGFVIVMILCVCITLQMLGVPATLLNPAGGESDTGGGSVLEGFTLLPALVQLMMSRQASALAVQYEPSVHDAVLTAVPFHPPV